LPDFTDCSFASRETHDDWIAVAHDGGPARAFDRIMPAFRDALTADELDRVIVYVRDFCTDNAWPRGELNLPRALVTEKAFPEDEAVLAVAAAAEGPKTLDQRIIFERRLGPRNQIEVIVPFGFHERTPARWVGGVGDITLGFKRDLFHSVKKGFILSAAGEAVLPTGDKDKNLGGGEVVLESYVAAGQLLPSASFLQFQGGFEVPADRAKSREVFGRAVIGKTFSKNRFGRSWSPMIELLGAREMVARERVRWDVVPQLQVSLSTRQHVLFNAGVRTPVNDAGGRATQILFYLLWDWFDGGLFSGW
jgi:hypothetical protein